MIKARFGHDLDATVRRVAPFLFRRQLNPNLLTLLGACVSLVAALLFAHGQFVAAGIVMLAGGAFDLIDGVVARVHGITTRFGAFLDSTLDRVVDMGLLLGVIAWYAAAGETGHVLLAAYTMAASVLVSYAQARAELVVPDFRVGTFERAERILILAAGAVTGLLVPALWIVAAGSTITVAQRFAAAHREMNLLDAGEPLAREGAR